jgi:hypothetical protein
MENRGESNQVWLPAEGAYRRFWGCLAGMLRINGAILSFGSSENAA